MSEEIVKFKGSRSGLVLVLDAAAGFDAPHGHDFAAHGHHHRRLIGAVRPRVKGLVEGSVDKVVGAPLSDVAFLVREAARLAAKAGKTEIDQSSLDDALARIPGTKKEKRPRIGF